MPCDVERLETALCDHADAALGQLEVRQVALHGVRSDRSEILTAHDGGRVGDGPHAFRGDAELLTVGQVAGQLDPPDAQQWSDDWLIAARALRLFDTGAGMCDPMALMKRVAGVAVMSTRQSSTESMEIARDHGVTQRDVMSQTTGSTGVAELK